MSILTSLRKAVGWGLVAVAVIIALAAVFAPADTAVFIVRGLHQLTIVAEYDANKGTLAITGTGADARIVELAIAAFVGVAGYLLSRDGSE